MKVRRLNLTLLASLLATVAAVCLVASVIHFLSGKGVPPERAISELRLTTDALLEPQLRSRTRDDDDRALELLTIACTSERTALRNAARQVLSEKLDRWSLLPPAEAARRAALLARHLREHANHIPDDLQPFATDVVTRLLLIPSESPSDSSTAANTDPLVDDCVAALRRLGGRDRTSVTSDPVASKPLTPPPADFDSPNRLETDSDSTRTAGKVPARK